MGQNLYATYAERGGGIIFEKYLGPLLPLEPFCLEPCCLEPFYLGPFLLEPFGWSAFL